MNKRLYALDGLRGVCAIAVMLYHDFLWNGTDCFQVGYFGVYMFFMLSGFSMWYVYAPKAPDAALLRHFFVARFARIAPLYVLASLLGGLARIYSQGQDTLSADFFRRLALNASLLFGLAMPGQSSFVPGGWSIGVECVFYLMFPLFLLFGRRLRAMAVLLVLSLALNQMIAASLLTSSTMAQQWVAYSNFPTFLVYFVAGMVSAMLYARLARAGVTMGAFMVRAVPVSALGFMFLYPATTQETFLVGPQVGLLVLAGMAGMLAAALWQPGRVEQRLFHFLGEVSYSTYLLHFFVYQAVLAALNRVAPGHSIWLLTGVAAPLTLALAAASYRWFEHPVRLWINRRLA
jgi:exopolysaccharide production protein ExoZ